MPTTYAHWRFGDMCQETLPEDLKKIVKKYRKYYDFGVQGPDIFFYYKVLKKNDVKDYGYKTHKIPLQKTLEPMRGYYESSEDKNAFKAYLLGFLAHFALDSYCHGYIERVDESTEYSHGTVESQFDRYLLIKDGYDPIKKKVTFSLKPRIKIAKTLSEVYPQFSERVMFGVIVDIKKYLTILKDNSDIKRQILTKTFKLTHTEKYIDLLIGKENISELSATMLRLDKLLNKAVEHYPILARSLNAYLEDGTKLDAYFHNHFCPKEDYKNIPFLSLDAEKNYEVEFQD